MAFEEAEAAQCAGEQGKFWEYTDALYAAQNQINSAHDFERELAPLAQGIHADPVALKACLDSGKFGGAINNEIAEAESLKIDSTPTNFIDNKRVEGTMTPEDLDRLLANR
jgi:protein-disulfide isomerase